VTDCNCSGKRRWKTINITKRIDSLKIFDSIFCMKISGILLNKYRDEKTTMICSNSLIVFNSKSKNKTDKKIIIKTETIGMKYFCVDLNPNSKPKNIGNISWRPGIAKGINGKKSKIDNIFETKKVFGLNFCLFILSNKINCFPLLIIF